MSTGDLDDDPPVQCWHTEADTPCDWDVCRQPERLAVGDTGTDPALRDRCCGCVGAQCCNCGDAPCSTS